MPSRQFVIVSREQSSNGEMAPIGSRQEIVQKLREFNTGPDHENGETLYGPGICIDLPPDQDPVTQMLLYLNEEEIAWPVIMRLGKAMHWKLLDMATGRELAPGADDDES